MPVHADNAVPLWEVAATVGQRTLIERDAAGARLLTEKGPLARLRAAVRPPAAPGLEFSASLAQGRLDYDGRTQAGAALSTRSTHDEAEFGVKWRPLGASAWGEPSLTLDALRVRRVIAGTASTASLTETSTLAMPGVAWASPTLALGGLGWTAEAQWRASAHHHLAVDYGGLFDASSLRGGRRDEAMLRLLASAPGAWRWSLEWRHARQGASSAAALYRGGQPAGSVRQPLLAIDDVLLSLARSF